MTVITDAQATATTNGTTDAKAIGTTGSTGVPVPAATIATTPVFVSGTARTLNTGMSCHLYINVTTSASLTLSMGPTSAASVSINAAESDTLGMITLRVPAGWYVKFTGTVADVVFTQVND